MWKEQPGDATTTAPRASTTAAPAAETAPAIRPTAEAAPAAPAPPKVGSGNVNAPELPAIVYERQMVRAAQLMLEKAELGVHDLLKVWPESAIDKWGATFASSEVAEAWIRSFDNADQLRIIFTPLLPGLIQDRLGEPLGNGKNHGVKATLNWPNNIKGSGGS
jgi:hypothetical protein